MKYTKEEITKFMGMIHPALIQLLQNIKKDLVKQGLIPTVDEVISYLEEDFKKYGKDKR